MSPLYNRLLKVLKHLNKNNIGSAHDVLSEIMDDDWSGKGPWCPPKNDQPWFNGECNKLCKGVCKQSYEFSEPNHRKKKCKGWRCDGTGPAHRREP